MHDAKVTGKSPQILHLSEEYYNERATVHPLFHPKGSHTDTAHRNTENRHASAGRACVPEEPRYKWHPFGEATDTVPVEYPPQKVYG